MLYSEYAWELHLRKLQEEGLEEGLQKGLEKGRQMGLEKGLEEGRQQGLEKGLEEGRQQGLEKGLQEGQRLARIEDTLELLSEIDVIPDSIRERITSETNLDTLKQWYRNAARCQTIQEFIDQM